MKKEKPQSCLAFIPNWRESKLGFSGGGLVNWEQNKMIKIDLDLDARGISHTLLTNQHEERFTN